jgi:uncharacterized membrane protein YdbT with pleckstrin-like domain
VSYVQQSLIPGEKVLYKTGLHWIVLVTPIFFVGVFGLWGLMLLIGGLAGESSMLVAAVVLLLIAGALGGYAYMKRAAVEMAVTNNRIVVKSGVLSRKTFELMLSKVESIGVEEGMLGRILGYGSVVVRGTGGTPEPFKNIAHPLEFRRQVQQQVELREQPVQQKVPVLV